MQGFGWGDLSLETAGGISKFSGGCRGLKAWISVEGPWFVG